MKPLARSALLGALLVVATTVPGWAAPAMKTAADRLVRELPLGFDGTFRIDNPNGNITIIGTEQASLSFVAERIVTAVDDDSLNEARRVSGVHMGSDGHNVLLQSLIPFPNPNGRWGIAVNYTVRVPRTVHVQAFSGIGDRIVINNIAGNVLVKNTSAAIELINVSGSTDVQTSNGSISISLSQKPTTNIRASSINGKVTINLPRDSAFNWTAETLKGELLSNLDLRGDFDPNRPGKFYRAVARSTNGPRIETFTVTGSIEMTGRGSAPLVALRPKSDSPRPAPAQAFPSALVNLLLQQPTARSYVFQHDLVDGDLEFDTSLGNIFVGELRGSAHMRTGGGEIVLGKVMGSCDVQSFGGPINIGEVVGPINARTEAGDVTVTSAQRGGFAGTGGGNVVVGYAGAAITVVSGGGDVTVRRSIGAVTAEAHSGDVSITVDPNLKTLKIDAKAIGGNVLLNLGPSFGADIDATITTSNPDANTINSDLSGLTITTERIGNRSRIHAVGKVNGGGQRVELRTEEGNIQIRSSASLRKR